MVVVRAELQRLVEGLALLLFLLASHWALLQGSLRLVEVAHHFFIQMLSLSEFLEQISILILQCVVTIKEVLNQQLVASLHTRVDRPAQN